MKAGSPEHVNFPGLIEGLPNICGWENDVMAAAAEPSPVFLPHTNLSLAEVASGFAIALHMHQPTIPGGRNGALINNLQYMFENPYKGDNHNAGPFAYCYGRMGDFIPELVSQGCNPRIMLSYTGTLLWGLQQMGREDILGKLRNITCTAAYQPYVEWLGTFWGHGLATTTPQRDFKLHIQAWQHHFAALFGLKALERIRGFVLPKMQLPHHPDTLYALVKALKECGYQWMMVSKEGLESLEGKRLARPHSPHRLIVENSHQQTIEMLVLIQAGGSDFEQVGKMQIYSDAQTLLPERVLTERLQQRTIPPLALRIADGENGGVMMNEFPSAFKRTWHDAARRLEEEKPSTVGINGTEYLELLRAEGFLIEDFPSCRAVRHIDKEPINKEPIDREIDKETQTVEATDQFNMIGGWKTRTQNTERSEKGVLSAAEDLSLRFHNTLDHRVMREAATSNAEEETQATQNFRRQHRYRNALLHNLLLQTSCFRHWGEGDWSDYAGEIYRRGVAILEHDF